MKGRDLKNDIARNDWSHLIQKLTILSEELNPLSVGRCGFIWNGILGCDGMVLTLETTKNPL